MNNESKYIIWSPNGTMPPRYIHETESAATKEANRLAGINKGSVFYVMRAVISFKYPISPEIIHYQQDDIPF